MFSFLKKITERPAPYASYTAEALWNDPYISKQMLKCHLDPSSDLASRNIKFVEASAAFLQSRFNLGHGKTVIDFGCGPGLYTTRFARMGCKVTGIDFSINSIEYARNEADKLGLDVTYLHLNYLDYRAAETHDLATMIFCDYCVLSEKQRKKLLKIMKDSITNYGYIFMDICSEHMYEMIEEGTCLQRVDKEGFWSAKPHYEFRTTFKYDEYRVSLEKFTIVEEKGSFEIFNWLKYFTPEELTQEFEDSGLEVSEIYMNFGGTSCIDESEVMAVVAHKVKV